MRLEKIRFQDQIKRETKERRQTRANMREQLRIANLQEIVINNIIKSSPLIDWTPKVPILDVRSYRHMTEPYICVFGGLVGELIMTFSSINDYILANPNIREGLGVHEFETFISALMGPETHFPKDALMIELTNDPSIVADENGDLIEKVGVPLQDTVNHAMDPDNIASFGLKFLVAFRDQILVGSNDIVSDIFEAIFNIVRREVEPMV